MRSADVFLLCWLLPLPPPPLRLRVVVVVVVVLLLLHVAIVDAIVVGVFVIGRRRAPCTHRSLRRWWQWSPLIHPSIHL